MAVERQYSVPLVGIVSVDAERGTVEIEVDLAEVSYDLRYDYEYVYPDPITERDQEVIADCMMTSPMNLTMRHLMSTHD